MSDKIDRYLYVNAKHDRNFGDSYGHLALTFCAQEWRDGEFCPLWPDSMLGYGVVIACQTGGVTDTLSYGWTVGIDLGSSQFHPSSCDKTARALKFADKMGKNVARCSDRYGHPKTFGQFVGYAIDGLSVQGLMRKRGEDGTGMRNRTDEPDRIVYAIDSLVDELARTVKGEDSRLAKCIAMYR